MSEMAERFQFNLKRSSGGVALFFFKALSGLVLALTLSLMIQEVLGQTEKTHLMSMVFMLLVFTAVFLRLAKKWSFTVVLVFDLFCVLVGIILRLYIMVAPGA